MMVIIACQDDIPAWNELARQVEPLFGAPMADHEDFQKILLRKIDKGLAFCIRENDGPPGTALCGGLFFSTSHHPIYQIDWLVVAEKWRRTGVGRALIRHACGLVISPAEVIVTTFDQNDPEGEPARRFYESLGFAPAELLPDEGPNGETRQRYRKVMDAE
jgi:ribosomal protein S18 acetylase RimI-like enzyme